MERRFSVWASRRLDFSKRPCAQRTPLFEALLGILRLQQDRFQQRKETVQHLLAEIALLQRKSPRPEINPSLLETIPPRARRREGSSRPGSANLIYRHSLNKRGAK